MGDKVPQHLGLHLSQSHRSISYSKFEGTEINGLSGEGQLFAIPCSRFSRFLEPLAASQEPVQARDQNCQLKGLGQVIVCSSFEAFKNILGTPSRGEHEN